jgi:hypothetical protein
MTRLEFIKALKSQTSDAAVFGTKANLEKPPGKKPREQDVKLSQWYGNLPDSDRASVDAAMREAAELAVFSFLCVLDGVSAIEDGPEKGELALHYIKRGENLRLNDPADESLHDAYNGLCKDFLPIPPQRSESRLYEVGPASQLREHQTSSDAMDLHSMPKGHKSSQPDTPSIALPKNEHRKL